jgi:hypothetical protein
MNIRDNAEKLCDVDVECLCGSQPFAVREILQSKPEIETVRIECRQCGRQTGQFYGLDNALETWKTRHGAFWGREVVRRVLGNDPL